MSRRCDDEGRKRRGSSKPTAKSARKGNGAALSPQGVNREIRLAWKASARNMVMLTAYLGDEKVYSDLINLSRSDARRKFGRALQARLFDRHAVRVAAALIEDELLRVSLEVDEIQQAAGEAAVEATFEMVDDGADDPSQVGIWMTQGGVRRRLTNFTARLVEDVVVHADGREPQLHFVGHTFLGGARNTFTLTPPEFTSNDKLAAVLVGAAGSGAAFLVDKVAPVRTAMSLVGREGRAIRSMTADHGWHGTGANRRYLTVGGYVDAGGYHAHTDDPAALRVELPASAIAHRLGMTRLTPGRLKSAGQLVVEHFLELHGRAVMISLLGVVATAVLEPFAGHDQRFALWLKGQTGSGKSYAAKTAMGFFGDFDPALGGHFASWTWTPNAIEMAGHAFRNALFLCDDYKLDLHRKGEVVRIMQLYADRQGRGRLNADSTAKPVAPMRGQLLSTGEDVPINSSSALGRTIVWDVPNRPKQLERGEELRRRRGELRGLMAGFLAHLIADGRLDGFSDRFAACKEIHYTQVAGQANDARIAGNFGLLAASVFEFARYLGRLGAWPAWRAEIREFSERDLPAVRDAMLGRVADEQPSNLFLGTLRDLLAARAIRLVSWPLARHWGDEGKGDRTPIVGRIKEGVAEVMPEIALGQVQEALRKQGRPELAVSKETLLDQLAADGCLLDRQGGKIRVGARRRTFQVRVLGPAEARPYVIRLPAQMLGLG